MVPTPAAWRLGWASATLLIERHRQEHGEWPRRMALSAWGTSNMRTGGDDIAQALALMGVQPAWEGGSGRVTGFEVMPLGVLDRPRVDVTFRLSGFFRDAARRARPAARRCHLPAVGLLPRRLPGPDRFAGFGGARRRRAG
jgi:cobaltochelatase CobN